MRNGRDVVVRCPVGPGRLVFLMLAIASGTWSVMMQVRSVNWRGSGGQVVKQNATDGVVFDGVYARAFRQWVGDFPCDVPERFTHIRSTDRMPIDSGFIHLKLVKTGSTTAASVHLRISHNVAKAKLKAIQKSNSSGMARRYFYLGNHKTPFCRMRYHHTEASALNLTHRDRKRSFVWTILRDPTRRAISRFFFREVSRNNLIPTDNNFLQNVRNDGDIAMHYFHALDSTHRHNGTTLAELYNDLDAQRHVANQIMGSYDFIAVTERMDESIVALQLLLGLGTRDVLRLADAKRAGSYDNGASSRGCVYIQQSVLSENMQEYFYGKNNAEWKRRIQISEAMHQAANASLDMTIQSLGHERFQEALNQFLTAQRRVSEKCETHLLVPCSNSSGIRPRKEICIDLDMGCGFECIDSVSDELGLPEYTYTL